jgi:hypothetical protein
LGCLTPLQRCVAWLVTSTPVHQVVS